MMRALALTLALATLAGCAAPMPAASSPFTCSYAEVLTYAQHADMSAPFPCAGKTFAGPDYSVGPSAVAGAQQVQIVNPNGSAPYVGRSYSR
jgi:hypothetical protein